MSHIYATIAHDKIIGDAKPEPESLDAMMEEKRHTPGPWSHQDGIIWSDHGRIAVTCFSGLNDEESDEADDANAILIASAPLLKEQVRLLREALLEIAGTSANENSGPDRMADALGEIQGIVHRALEATKEEA